MAHSYIKQLIEFACYQFETKLAKSDIPSGEYFDLLNQFPEKIKKQTEKSIETLEKVDVIKLFTNNKVIPDYWKSMSELNDAFQKCNTRERLKITQAQLAPFQVDQFARQLALAPGIILAYEHVKEVKI